MASDLQQCVDTIGVLLGLPVSLTDVDLNSLRFSPHSEDAIDEVRRHSLLMRTTAPWVREWFFGYGVGKTLKPVRVEPHPERDTMSRLVVPVLRRGVPLGFLCILDPDRRCTDDDLSRVREIVDELAELMYDEEADRLETSRFLHELLTGTASSRARALRGLEHVANLSGDSECLIVAISGIGDRKGRQKAARDRRTLHRRSAETPVAIAQCVLSDCHVFLLRPGTFHQEPEQAQLDRLIAVAADCCRKPAVGISEATALTQAPIGYDQARAALSAAVRVQQLPYRVRFENLGALRLIATRSDAELEMTIDRHTRALIAASVPDLLLTVQTYLDTACDAAETAARLHIHRGTLYYRLRKAQDMIGLDLAHGPDRLTLSMGLEIHQFLASPRRIAHPGPPHLLRL